MTQLFGDRALCANATGCSSIYGGNLPTTPYCKRADGLGPAWSNSLFEDNAEFGMGMRLTADKLQEYALMLVKELVLRCTMNWRKPTSRIRKGSKHSVPREDASPATDKLNGSDRLNALKEIAHFIVKKSVWIIGGDGWAYDIGYGGLDHVLASGENVNVLVLDTEVYSNTGGQMSKSTPRALRRNSPRPESPAQKKPRSDDGLWQRVYRPSGCGSQSESGGEGVRGGRAL
jgi:pyruvate-ferredoxin/flavodoxin oxidoreductase